MAKKTSVSQVLRKTQKTVVSDKGRVTFGKRKGLMGKGPADIFGGDSPLPKKRKK
ncbi:MAG: hypothetical protein Q7R76_00095 [Candidatus Woesearchaeota archaeon]|nr:hypothetical protein [Candidatus Woesearchaeota archaeon]